MRHQTGATQPRAPEEHWILAALRKDHAVKLDQRYPRSPADTVIVQFEGAIVQDTRKCFGLTDAM